MDKTDKPTKTCYGMKKKGLTLGKFAPLHKGHQYLFETALKEVDELIIIIYDTSATTIPLPIRANWIRNLYPGVTVIEAWDGPDGYSNERAYEIKEELYVQSLLKGEKITHFYSSEFYGAHMSLSMGAIDRRVDERRVQVPISATKVRENPYQYREFISDIVYKDLITKIVFVGAMSTGKSTIAEALAKTFDTSFVPEYGREYWKKNQVDRRISFEAFDEITTGHIECEEAIILKANKYLFVDTNAITTYMFALDYHGKASVLLTQIAIENASRYDLFFLCDDDIAYDDTWDRSGEQKRKIFHKQIITDLNKRKIPYILLQGSLEARMSKVSRVLSGFKKYANFYGSKYQ